MYYQTTFIRGPGKNTEVFIHGPGFPGIILWSGSSMNQESRGESMDRPDV